jgi:class 3 adenylate cyclase/DNA-binding CsgD family transcriptional regulator
VSETLPTGTVTVLFTDIEGSTQLLKKLRDRYGGVLADHHRLLRDAFAAHGGYEMGTAGDAFFVAFPRARDAVEAAVDAQRALVGHIWPDGLECRVRMGLHTGEPTLGEDGYRGIVMHRGARIADAAHGGQILLSSSTAELLQDDLPDGVSLAVLGERQLKDIDRPERLYQLVAEGLRLEFPEPRAKAAPRRARATLVGREDECALIERLLDDARSSRSGALAIRGEAGVGKSALLGYGVEQAGDFLVLRATGFESEAELAFSGLLQLCRPLLGRLDELPGHQSRALAAALGVGPAEETERLTIGVATLALLALAAEDADVLVAIDDAQWLDSASIEAILFAARRFEADRIAVLLTVREDGSGFQTPGTDELRLRGLDQEAAGQLLAEHAPHELSPGLAARLYELTEGNPLALVELPRALTDAQLEGIEAVEQPLNLGARVERAFRGRVEALPQGAQRALLIASASESDRLDTIVAALGQVGLDSSALQEAEDAGLVSLESQALVFRHPLVRSAIYHSAAPSERRAAHSALAAALVGDGDEERRAWQLASAAVGPDEEVATALDQAGAAAGERAGYAAASAAYERAARLSPAKDSRLRRLHAAAEAAWNAGQTARAVSLLEEALADVRDPVLRGHLLNLRGHIERHTALPGPAYEMLSEAASLLDEASPFDAATARIGAWRCSVLLGRGRLECARTLSEKAERDGGIQEFFACLALGIELRGREPEKAVPLLERASLLVEEKGEEMFIRAPLYLSLAGMPSEYLGDLEKGLQLCTWAVEWGRDRGIYGALPVSLRRKARFERELGRWQAAYASFSESASIGAEQGTTYFQYGTMLDLAWFEARRGEEAALRAHVEEADRLCADLGREPDPVSGARVAMLHLTLGRLDEGIAAYEALVFDSSGNVVGRQFVPALLEAYVRTGRTAEAVPLIEPFVGYTERWPTTVHELARCHGLVASEEEFERHFEEALGYYGAPGQSFDEAHTRLCYGERLRRAGRRRDARDQLRPALETFERLGAAPWAERARAELRATGERLRARGPEHEELTAQELRIALQAAEGKTNRQIGATLFLSPKTVEFHLGRVYRKLGIASRAELIRHFAAGTAPELVRQ